jgi:hypothetical protein
VLLVVLYAATRRVPAHAVLRLTDIRTDIPWLFNFLTLILLMSTNRAVGMQNS